MPDGRWLQVAQRRTRDGGELSIGADVTARKEQAERLLRNEQRLLRLVADQNHDRRMLELQAEKLSDLARRYRRQIRLAQQAKRAKSAFLANMSHELKTPLNAVIGFSQVIEQGVFGPLGSSRYDDYIRDIRKAGEELDFAIDDLLRMSEIEAGTAEIDCKPIDIAEPAHRALQAVRPSAAAKGILIRCGAMPALKAVIDGNATALILLHLLRNSVKFTNAGGTVSLSIHRGTGVLRLFVSDSGSGIAPELLPILGRPFEQFSGELNNGMKGIGLGLAIAQALTQMQGGRLNIRSRIGQGTVVMVSVPDETANAPQGLRGGARRPDR